MKSSAGQVLDTATAAASAPEPWRQHVLVHFDTARNVVADALAGGEFADFTRIYREDGDEGDEDETQAASVPSDEAAGHKTTGDENAGDENAGDETTGDDVTRLRIHIVQIYVNAGIRYSFTHVFQRRMQEILSNLVRPSGEFSRRYGSDFAVVFNLSAQTGISVPRIVGPAVYRKTKDVEYTIFLPHDGSDANQLDDYTKQIRDFLAGVIDVLERLKLDAAPVKEKTDDIVREISSDPAMIDKHRRSA
jgi:hypothetical protein